MRLAPLVAGLGLACADGRSSLSVPVVIAPSEPNVVLEDGVEVSFDHAELTLADLRLEGPIETARRWPRLSLIQAAHAHPGHDAAGAVTGELLGAWTVDLLGDPVDAGSALCWEGDLSTARLGLPAEPAATFEGTASVDGTVRPFSFTVSPGVEVTGLPAEGTLDSADPLDRMTLSVDLAAVVTHIDWRTEDSDGDGILTIHDGDIDPTLHFGAVSSASYRVTLETQP